MHLVSQQNAHRLLQYTLGLTFFWFGILKLFNASPVEGIIRQALPEVLANSQLLILVIALIEMAIGIGFLLNKLVRPLALLMIGHLLVATVSVLLTQGFDPRFPVLSLAGEFVVKNLVLMAAGVVFLSAPDDIAKEKKKD